jgi:hypothetical protein
MPTAKHLNVTADKINNFNALVELALQVFLRPDERGKDNDSDIAREFKKQLIGEYMAELDVDRFDELANAARDIANKKKLNDAESNKNILDETNSEEGGEEMF